MTKLFAKGVLIEKADHLVVDIVWSSDTVKIDRPVTSSICFKKSHKSLAERFIRMVNANKHYMNPPKLMTDNSGETYVSAFHPVLGRTANADLKRLGY